MIVILAMIIGLIVLERDTETAIEVVLGMMIGVVAVIAPNTHHLVTRNNRLLETETVGVTRHEVDLESILETRLVIAEIAIGPHRR